MALIVPTPQQPLLRCTRCREGPDQTGVWILPLIGGFALHAGCAAALQGDLDGDLRALIDMAGGPTPEPAHVASA